MNKLVMFLFGIVEETIILHTDDEYYPSQAILTIVNRCWVDDIEVVNSCSILVKIRKEIRERVLNI